MSVRKNVIYYIKKNIFIVLVLISLCPVLALSYAKFTINSESYRSNEMYISELLYSIKIDNENTYTIDIEPGETEHIIEITSLNAISTNYKLAYLNNNNLEVKYASDYLEPSFGGILTKRTISLTIKNTSTEKQTLSLMVFGGYSFNEVDEVKVLDTYTEIKNDYWKYDYETTALYIDNTRVNELDSDKRYSLVSYTCSNDVTVEYNSDTRKILVDGDKQTKCSLYFEELKITIAQYLINNYKTLGLTKISQSATGNQNYATTEYRYQGASPNNYITFNNETGVWRIIGVFEVETPNENGTYAKEYKVKIIRDSIGNTKYNTSNKNNWVLSSIKLLLNEEYYSKTGAYSNIGLTEQSKSQIDNTKWYLGNVVWNDSHYYSHTKDIYIQERSANVHSGYSQFWEGKIGLLYTSDYMYASSGCYNDTTKKGKDVNISAPYDTDYRNIKCKSTDWLHISDGFWNISPASYDTTGVMMVSANGDDGVNGFSVTYTYSIRPSIYLASSVGYKSGSGTASDPFIIK